MNGSPQDSFTMMPNWVIRDSTLSANEFLVYQALLSRADRSMRAWPSKRLLASDSRLSEPTVKRTIPLLAQRGLIAITVRPRGDGTNASNLYHVTVLPKATPKPGSRYAYLLRPTPPKAGGLTGGPSAAGEGVTVNPSGGQGDPDQGVTMSREEDTWEEHTDEEDIRSELPFRPDASYFDDAPEDLATDSQMAYVRDLYIQHHNVVPSQNTEDQIKALSPEDAGRLIRTYLRAIKGRGGMYDGPEEGTPEYDALSPTGQLWADEGMLPPDMWLTPLPSTPVRESAAAGAFRFDW